jgi:hypothetical protein
MLSYFPTLQCLQAGQLTASRHPKNWPASDGNDRKAI